MTLGDNVYIDDNTIIRDNVTIGANSTVGANSILGEYLMDFYRDREQHVHPLVIGDNAIIRSGTKIYGDTTIGDNFQSGHNVTIREKAVIGQNVSVGTLSDIQGHCKIGNYVRMHSNVHIGTSTQIDDYVWIYPYTVFTNDPTPPSETEMGVHVYSFAVVATSSTILPGVQIHSDSLVAAGATVVKDVNEFEVVGGCPAKVIGDIRNIRNKETGEPYYPWRNNFGRAMPWAGVGYEQWVKSQETE